MNIVKELRKKKGIQQKELAIAIGVSNPTVSAWESNKKDPSGERLKKLAEYFGVDELVILGKGVVDLNNQQSQNLFIPEDPKVSGVSETDQIIQHILAKLEGYPKTAEAKILSVKVDQLPKKQRELAVAMFDLMFAQKFSQQGGTEDEDT